MPPESPIIQTFGLTKQFKHVRAVDSLDLAVRPGELFGLIGPDGAGKTTTLRLLAGLLDISDGSATVAGFDLKSRSESIKPLIGYMAQEFSLYGELTVLENLRFFSELYDVSRSERRERTDRLLEFAGLTEFTDRRGKLLSGGMKKKLALACTLIHRPQILLLDEPTTGVDPISRRGFWDILTELHLEGTTILVSTPYMDEADRCTRVGLMFGGQLFACDTPLAIRAGISGDLVALKAADWRRAKSILQDLEGVLEIQLYGDALHVRIDSARKRLPRIKRELRRNGVDYRSLRPAPVRMEEAFLSLMGQREQKS
ncbi:MAG: ABC transporter ATP-binding protein [Anaerolineae bacterium]|nr:MAG: ABC transporter ATP-binding protein [Anaerolineae bacterium]